MFPNLEKLFGEKNYYMKHGIVWVYTKKLFESDRILHFFMVLLVFGRISLILSFRSKQVNDLELQYYVPFNTPSLWLMQI